MQELINTLNAIIDKKCEPIGSDDYDDEPALILGDEDEEPTTMSYKNEPTYAYAVRTTPEPMFRHEHETKNWRSASIVVALRQHHGCGLTSAIIKGEMEELETSLRNHVHAYGVMNTRHISYLADTINKLQNIGMLLEQAGH